MSDLITIQDYKTAKTITGTTNDDKLELLIPAVSNLIQAYIGYPIINAAAVEEVIVSPFSTNTIHLNGYPINEIVSVEESDSYLGFGFDSTVTYVTVLEGSGYIYNPSTGGLIKKYGEWNFPVNVTYTSGFVTVPPDLKLATIAMVEFYLKEHYIQSKAMMGTSTSYTIAKDIPPHIKLILDAYKY